MARGRAYILREFLGHNFVSGLRTLKPKKLKRNFKNLKTSKLFLKKLVFFPALIESRHSPFDGQMWV